MYGNVFDKSKYYIHFSSCKYGDNLKLCDSRRSYFCATLQDDIFFDLCICKSYCFVPSGCPWAKALGLHAGESNQIQHGFFVPPFLSYFSDKVRALCMSEITCLHCDSDRIKLQDSFPSRF